MKKRLFVDMDGTVAQFYESKRCLEEMREDGFFRNLKTYKRMVAALKKFMKKHHDVDVFILSACISEQCIKEKHEWLDKYLPEIPLENRIFLMVGENKADAVRKIAEEIAKNDYLLDDYTNNLEAWVAANGTGIKVRNEINCKNGTWRGSRVSCYDAPDGIIADLEDIIFG